ncbi:ABC transporter ATP-binding protein [Roseicyclus mahoneyensis]|uniref:Peptide/nickel transport system ATP-binding protein n=1 Tax=Roseicyclus mahoneyensis TaxID=164332 RepID=A0A316GI74_9RHOB|nr:ABC transporter ATP-binding protein [Roseicyclus mahoneyensis]PWK60280.1 peptide/nickel transport system ATP-binding protein [Roseicyclus mahoneyensis]
MTYQSDLAPTLLEVRGLRTEFDTRAGTVTAVDGVSFTIEKGERVAIVGESGSGKSAMAMSLLRLLAHPGRVAGGQVLLDGRDLASLSERALNAIRGREVGTVFQDPMSSLDPVMKVSRQMVEPIMRNLGLSREAARAEAIRWLDKVGIPDPEGRIDAYPFEMSGGMRQRVMIAMALSCRPRLVIADEPTTALDVTIQAQIVEMLKDLTAEAGAAMMFITHDLGLVARFAHKVAVMYAGRIVEFGPVDAIFAAPQHPYTQSLLRTIPSVDATKDTRLPQIPGIPPDMRHKPEGCAFRARCAVATARCALEAPELTARAGDLAAACWVEGGLRAAPQALEPRRRVAAPLDDTRVTVEINNLVKHFEGRGFLARNRRAVRAVNGVSLRVRKGETLGIVGESGCGKSTVARLLLGLDQPTSGEIFIDGLAQMVFQDPFSSFNPKMTIARIIEEPLAVQNWGDRASRAARIEQLITQVGLEPAHLVRYPSQLSGGQRQRVAIARALALNPSVVVADEPTSALDVSVRAQIINLLADLKADLGISFVFISHDLLTVRYISDRIAVMYLGEVVEYGPAEDVFDRPMHPYTRALIDAVPIPDPRLEAARTNAPLRGDLPSPLDLPVGCAFASRCPMATAMCRTDKPRLKKYRQSQEAACHYAK